MSTLVDLVFAADETKDLCQLIAPVGTFAVKNISGGAYLVSSPSDDAANDGMPLGMGTDPTVIVVSSEDNLYLKNTSNSSGCTVRVYYNR